mmetsp:Transcript_18259/g.45367  ORF Transcript_18259/g.45367 Transcript_18259/m.45367 type:complete len:209 (+) Transcript_18259:472-1098(+)
MPAVCVCCGCSYPVPVPQLLAGCSCPYPPPPPPKLWASCPKPPPPYAAISCCGCSHSFGIPSWPLTSFEVIGVGLTPVVLGRASDLRSKRTSVPSIMLKKPTSFSNLSVMISSAKIFPLIATSVPPTTVISPSKTRSTWNSNSPISFLSFPVLKVLVMVIANEFSLISHFPTALVNNGPSVSPISTDPSSFRNNSVVQLSASSSSSNW